MSEKNKSLISEQMDLLKKAAETECDSPNIFVYCPRPEIFREIFKKWDKGSELEKMYRNNEKRIILKDVNFLIYLADEKDRDEVLKEIDESGEYNGEDVFISPQQGTTEWLAKKKNGEWVLEEKPKPLFFT